MAEGYPALIPVGAKFQLNLVADHYFYVMQTHLAGQIGQDHPAVFQLDPEFGVRKSFNDRPYNFYFLFVVQNEYWPLKQVVMPSGNTEGGRPTT